MATAAPAKPLPPAQKLKRPPPPFVQTGVNGTKPSQTSPSPSTIKRPPGLKQPPNTNGANGVVANGTGPRATNRQRKETQRPGEAYANRLNRLSTRSVASDGSALTGNSNRVTKKAMVESYVRTTAHILKKFSKRPPSFSLHLYPTNFKIEGQDGSFGYNSPMKALLEHIKAQTIPHDMMEEFRNAGFQVYDESLIIRIVDHRSSASTTSTSTTTSSRDDTNKPFSVHNWNEHLLPSPYAAFPARPSPDTQPSQQPAPDAEPSTADASDGEAPVPALASNEPKVFTTVLHPTPLSLLTDMTILATTPDPRPLNRRLSQAFPARTPASATMAHPPTPLSAVPQTPVNERGPPAKKQKMMLEARDFHDYEAKVINAVAPPLYLEPLDSLPEAQELLKLMRSELHSRDPPSPKTRKRTVAELAADDARAAEEERFILIMDERLGSTASGAAAAGGGNDQAGAAFEPRFNRFKTLESLKIQQEEKMKREHERKMQQDHLARQQKEEAERAKRQQLLDARARENELRQQEAARRQQLQAQLNQQANGAPQVNGMIPNMQNMPNMHQQPNMMHATQGQHSSPVVRTQTPQHSSPTANAMMGTHAGQSVPMNATSSNQGAGSPPRPGSALQQPHPGVAAMAHSMSQNRSQQGPSRNGTPQMPQGTPAMQHATPVMRQVSVSTPRMSHGSPVGSTMAATPVMQAGMMATPNLTHQQMEIMRRQHAMQSAQMNGVRQLSPQQIAHLQQQQYLQQQAQQQQQHGLQQQQHGGFPQQQQMHPSQYQTAMRAQVEAQMRNLAATNQQQQHFQQQQQQQQQLHPQVQIQQMHGSPPHPGMGPNAQQQQQQLQMQNMSPQMQQQFRQRAGLFRQQLITQAQAQNGGQQLSEIVMTNINRRAQAQAMQGMRDANARAQAMQQAAQQQAQRAQQMHMMGQQ